MPKSIHREELQRLLKTGAQLVDVLPPEKYEEDHLPGAISLPLRDIEGQTARRLDAGKPVIVYCWDVA